MPIYEYRCASCGHQQEFLQKVSDAPHTTCPQCGKPSLSKLLSAAGFQLKGSGWYATDFKGNGAKKPDPADGAKTDGDKGDGAKSGEPATTKPGDASTSSGNSSTSSGESSSPKAAAGCGGGCACH